MSHRIIAGIVTAVTLLTGFFAVNVSAVDIVSDEQMQAVRANCADIKTTLNRIEDRDALVRVRLGNALTVLSDKLMTPMNQRVAANRVDGAKLLEITAKYTQGYKGSNEARDFYNAYTQYEISIVRAMSIDCVKEPSTFIEAVNTARDNRMQLHDISQSLVELADAYRVEVVRLRDTGEFAK